MRHLAITGFTSCLLIVLAACGGGQSTPAETPTPLTPQNLKPQETIEVGEVVIGHSTEGTQIATEHWGAAVASLAERIYLSDVVVHVSLVSKTADSFTFRALEYLKGSGSTQFTVSADAAAHSAQWDGREAVLFLSSSSGSGSGGADKSASGSTFTFADTTQRAIQFLPSVAENDYSGSLPEGYSINSRNPVWMPSTTASSDGSGGARSASNSNPDFVTEVRSPDGVVTNPTVSLSEVKEKIAWITGGAGIDGYAECVEDAIRWERDYRDRTAYNGEPIQRSAFTFETESGAPAGATIIAFDVQYTSSYDQADARMWVEGSNAPLFTFGILDTDNDPSNGFRQQLETTRPLPAGKYSFVSRLQPASALPCDGENPLGYSNDEVIVSASLPNIVLEALFDPVSSGYAVGYSGTGDAFKPATFTTGDTTTTITSFYGTGDAVTMTLSPYVDLTTHIFDFITGDGTTMLSLTGATGDSAAGALTWGVSKQPWSSGDQLMLRISEPLITLSDNLAQKESSDTTLNLGSGYTTGPVLYQKLGPKVKLDNGTWAYGSEHDKFAVHRITLASDPGVRLTARFCRYDDDLHTIYHGTDSTFDYSPAIYEDCLAGDFVSSSDTAEGRRVLLHSAGGSVEVPGNGQKESQKWYLRIAPSDVSASGFKVRFTNSNEETGWAIANKVLWTEVNTGGSGSNDKANRLGKSVALQIDGRRLGCPSGMDLVDGRCTTP